MARHTTEKIANIELDRPDLTEEINLLIKNILDKMADPTRDMPILDDDESNDSESASKPLTPSDSRRNVGELVASVAGESDDVGDRRRLRSPAEGLVAVTFPTGAGGSAWVEGASDTTVLSTVASAFHGASQIETDVHQTGISHDGCTSNGGLSQSEMTYESSYKLGDNTPLNNMHFDDGKQGWTATLLMQLDAQVTKRWKRGSTKTSSSDENSGSTASVTSKCYSSMTTIPSPASLQNLQKTTHRNETTFSTVYSMNGHQNPSSESVIEQANLQQILNEAQGGEIPTRNPALNRCPLNLQAQGGETEYRRTSAAAPRGLTASRSSAPCHHPTPPHSMRLHQHSCTGLRTTAAPCRRSTEGRAQRACTSASHIGLRATAAMLRREEVFHAQPLPQSQQPPPPLLQGLSERTRA